MRRAFEWVAERWCRLMHDAPMQPIHERYQCRVCQRRFEVDWGVMQEKALLRRANFTITRAAGRNIAG